MKLHKSLKTLLFAGAITSLTACGISKPIVDADQLRWPDAAKAAANTSIGSFPNLQSLALVKTGMTRDQIMYLIGAPQTNEGFGARDWTYIFHFKQGGGDIATCFFKLTFDSTPLVSNIYWKPVSPEGVNCPPIQ